MNKYLFYFYFLLKVYWTPCLFRVQYQTVVYILCLAIFYVVEIKT